ncbi:Actin, muscle [Pelomyxa schiedti]|nr:Actin, muscle [Pelomyxa schiedti]
MTLERPIEHGIIVNWDNMAKVWDHAWKKIDHTHNRDPCRVLITEPMLNPLVQVERMTYHFFETYGIPALGVVSPAVALMGVGREEGVVLDIGDGLAQSFCMYDFVIPNSVFRVDLGGSDITQYLMRIMMEGGYSYSTSAEFFAIQTVKEQLSYVALDFEADMCRANCSAELEKTYELPDGTSITLGNERFRCAEALFQPYFMGREMNGVHEQTWLTMSRPSLGFPTSREVFTFGGATRTPGFTARLQRELECLAPASYPPKVKPECAETLTWVGCSILGSLSSFGDSCFTREQYDECGPRGIHTKKSLFA